MKTKRARHGFHQNRPPTPKPEILSHGFVNAPIATLVCWVGPWMLKPPTISWRKGGLRRPGFWDSVGRRSTSGLVFRPPPGRTGPYQSPLRSRSAISSTNGEKSSPPMGGRTLRIGARTGSVRLYTILASGFRELTRIHENPTATRTTSEYKSMSVATRRIKC